MELTNEFTVPVPVDRAWEVLNDVELIAPCLPGAQLQEIEGDEYRGVVKVKVGPITAEYKGAAKFREQDVEGRRVVLEASGRDTRGQGSASAVITATMKESGSGDGVSTHVTVDTDLTIKGKVAQFGRGMIAEVSSKLLTQFVECLEGKLDDGTAATPAATADAAATAGATATADEVGADEATSTDEAAEVTPAPADSAVPDGASSDTATPDTATQDTATPDTAGAAPTGNAAATEETAEPAVRRVEHEPNAPVDLLDAAGGSVAKRAVPAAAAFVVLLLIGRWRSHRRQT